MFYGCTKYPECKGSLEFNPDDVPAPAVARKPPPPSRKSRPKVKVVPIEAPLQPELRVTVPPLSPELVEQPDTESDPFDEDEVLFDD
jgi:ssDNA-binding Zn-finger/Zn-ribbon topoisomerase 1